MFTKPIFNPRRISFKKRQSFIYKAPVNGTRPRREVDNECLLEFRLNII